MMPSRRKAVVVALSLVASLAAGGCGATRGATTRSDPHAATTVRVENRGYLDRVIYLYVNSQRIRLGTVTGNTTQVLRIPQQYVFGSTELRFIADPIGGNASPISEGIVVTPGDQVTLMIPPGG